jgi:hypothetical protein
MCMMFLLAAMAIDFNDVEVGLYGRIGLGSWQTS